MSCQNEPKKIGAGREARQVGGYSRGKTTEEPTNGTTTTITTFRRQLPRKKFVQRYGFLYMGHTVRQNPTHITLKIYDGCNPLALSLSPLSIPPTSFYLPVNMILISPFAISRHASSYITPMPKHNSRHDSPIFDTDLPSLHRL